MVYFSGFHAWLSQLLSLRAQEDARQTDLIQQARIESSKVYSYRKLHDDFLDVGKACYEYLVARLANLAGFSAPIGYKRRLGRYGGKPAECFFQLLKRERIRRRTYLSSG